MRHDFAIQIEHLLHRSVEAREQHVVYDQNRERIGLLSLINRKFSLEPRDPVFLLSLIRPLLPRLGIVVVAEKINGILRAGIFGNNGIATTKKPAVLSRLLTSLFYRPRFGS